MSARAQCAGADRMMLGGAFDRVPHRMMVTPFRGRRLSRKRPQTSAKGGDIEGDIGRGSITVYVVISIGKLDYLAEGVGFEPTIRFPVYTLSKRAPSATRPSLQRKTVGAL